MESLPLEIKSMITHTLDCDCDALKSLCCVSRYFRLQAQPLLFRHFQLESPDSQDRVLPRLKAFTNTLKRHPSLYRAIRTIEITLCCLNQYNMPDTVEIARLLGPIFAKASKLRILALPIDEHILESLQYAVLPDLQNFKGTGFIRRSRSRERELCQRRLFMLSPALKLIHLCGLKEHEVLEMIGTLNLRDISFTQSHLKYKPFAQFWSTAHTYGLFAYTQPAINGSRKGTHFNPAQITKSLHSSRDSLEVLSLSIPCDSEYPNDYDGFYEHPNMSTKQVTTDKYLSPLTGFSSDQCLGPLTDFSSLRYLSVDQDLLSSEA